MELQRADAKTGKSTPCRAEDVLPTTAERPSSIALIEAGSLPEQSEIRIERQQHGDQQAATRAATIF